MFSSGPQNLKLDLLSFIRTADPTKVRIGERERDEGEPTLLETTVEHVVPLLPVAPDRFSGELEASVDKLFDDGGSGEQADQGNLAGGGYGTKVVDAGEPSHPAKKLRGDYGAPGVPAVGGKSYSAVQRFLAGAVQHAEVRGGVMHALSFVSSSVSITSKSEGGDYTELLAGANLRTLEAPQTFIISSDSSDPSGVNIGEAEVGSVVRTFVPIMTNATTATPTADPATIAKEKLVSASVFGGDSSSASGSHPISGGFSDRTGGDFLNVTNGFCMDDGGVCREMVDEFAPPKFFASIRGMKHDQLFTEFNVGEARQISLGAEKAEAMEAVHLRDETQTLKECNIILKKEKSELEVKVTDLAASVKVHELEVASSGFQEKLSHYEKLTKRLEEFQDAQLKVVNDKLEKLYADFVDMALRLEETFYPHLLTTIFGWRWLLTHGMKLAITKCLHSSEYLFALGVAIGKAIEKGMQDGLDAEITHGVEELRSSKDASVDTIMNILRLEDNLAERLGLTESQPCVDQLMVLIHHLPDRVVVGATSLSFALDVFDARVRKTRENITSQRPALRDVITPIFEPFSAKVLTGTRDDYEIAHTEGGEDAVADVKAVVDESADPFLDFSGAKLDVPE
uniref:Transposase (Putative), gypsy type n=1 Tax=Tanacetum cinerariifolium TaxID=118510 RepID=A0A6L2KIZ1_TANCI|nr:hypothetical protein [Tanacetum cinerariifolium]